MLRQALRATLRRGLCTAPPGLRVTLLHNPNCSKSRAALQLLSDYEPKLDLRVREYLRDPLSEAEVRELAAQLEGHAPADLLRARSMFDAADLDCVVRAVVDEPANLQRPIVATNGRAVIARPPSRAIELLDDEESLF